MTKKRLSYEQALALESGQRKARANQRLRAAQRALDVPQADAPAPFVPEEHASLFCAGGVGADGRCVSCGARRYPEGWQS
jgi:hypothetical protein